MENYKHISFRRPSFSPLPQKTALVPDVAGSKISSLPDLIRYNAHENPDYIFALQSEVDHDETNSTNESSYKASPITFLQLDSSPSVSHLLKKTGAKTILVSRRTQNSLSNDVNDLVDVIHVDSYQKFMEFDTDNRINGTEEGSSDALQGDVSDFKALILHSSGTTGFIIDDILSLPSKKERDASLELLAQLEFLAVGGGALKPEHGLTLTQHNVKLLNHYGVTEIGALAPIFRPGPDYNWRYLRLRSDLGLELRPIPNSTCFKLVGFPIGWNGPFEVQDELVRNPDSTHVEVRILGRTDDLIVLKTGEKVQPRQLEDALNSDPAVRAAVGVGNGSFQLAIIIDPADGETNDERMKDHVWELLSAVNPSLDHHARITSKKAIIIKPSHKPIPRSDKGSIMRQRVHELFKEEIDNAYADMESDALGEDFVLDTTNLEMVVRQLVASVAGDRLNIEEMAQDQDFFESGMDSLQAVRLSRLLSSALRANRGEDEKVETQVPVDLIYRNPSIRRLALETERLANLADKANGTEPRERTAEMKALADEFISRIDRAALRLTTPPERHVILMTGSTGNLGAHTLARLVRTATVKRVFCLVRGNQLLSKKDTDSQNGVGESNLLDRQRKALEAAGIQLRPEEWAKVEVMDLRLVFGGLKRDDGAQLSYLAQQVTHIIHLAWPMDFRRTLQSFRPHIELVQTLVEFARYAYTTRQETQPIRFLFSSSIAAVRYHAAVCDDQVDDQSQHIVPESAMQDPLVSAPMGYTEAKWVCERFLDYMGECFSDQVEPIIVRIGQLSGPEGTPGIWKTEEHIPVLVQASQKLGAFPLLDGVASWLPVDRAAQSLVEVLVHKGKQERFVHLENPVRQRLSDIFAIMGYEMRLPHPVIIPFEQWLERATEIEAIRSLEGFFKDHFRALAAGAVILDTTKSRGLSKTLSASGGLTGELITEYIRRWREEAFLK
ncbi:hypothetical protein AAE478_007555 [Parahypoxylon ruwenzoriense]